MTRLDGFTKQLIDTVVNRLHVGTSDDEVRADIRRRTGPRAGYKTWTQKQIEAAEVHALKTHHANQAMYARVMRGRP